MQYSSALTTKSQTGRERQMKKILNYERAFTLLSDSAIQHGVDRIVENPVEFIMKTLKISKEATWKYLKELERRELIAFNYNSKYISSVRILKKELPERIYEDDDMTRILKALWRYTRISRYDPEKQIVHSRFFGNIQGDANVLASRMYIAFQKFQQHGWIEIVYSKAVINFRINYLIIKNEFPKHLK